MPALDARTMLATGDLNASSSDFERKLREALAGRDPSSLEDGKGRDTASWGQILGVLRGGYRFIDYGKVHVSYHVASQNGLGKLLLYSIISLL